MPSVATTKRIMEKRKEKQIFEQSSNSDSPMVYRKYSYRILILAVVVVEVTLAALIISSIESTTSENSNGQRDVHVDHIIVAQTMK